jgi:CRP-like cAMP-binding protein
VSQGDLKRFALFGELSQDERETLYEEMERVEVDPGDALFREAEEANSLVLVVHGRVRLESNRAGALGAVGPGAALGAVSLVAVGPREASAFAETKCRLLVLRRSAFRRLVEDAPRAACRLAEAIASDVAGLLRSGLEPLLRNPVDRS